MLGALLFLLLFAGAPHVVTAAPADFMSYQGFLVDANGNPLATNAPANYPVIFRLYAESTGGGALWAEQQIVTVDKGSFSVVLGEGLAVSGENRPALSSVFKGAAARYMQLSVTIGATTTDLLPRLQMLTAPYAFLAGSANELVTPTGQRVVTYGNSRVEVAGNLYASGTISGNGSGLTGLSAPQLTGEIPLQGTYANAVTFNNANNSFTGDGANLRNLNASSITSGTLADQRLSANVAFRNAPNTFTASQIFNSRLGIGSASPNLPLTFGATYGDKVSFYEKSGAPIGVGLQAGLLQIHGAASTDDIAFGYGSSATMVEAMRIKGTGNVGIGTTNPAVRLHVVGDATVTGNIRVGSAGTDSLISGLEGLRIVRGRVAASGGIISGTGFTVVADTSLEFGRTVTNGTYTITFNPQFSGAPVVTATALSDSRTYVAGYSSVAPNSVQIRTYRTEFYYATDGSPQASSKEAREFSFIAIGPR